MYHTHKLLDLIQSTNLETGYIWTGICTFKFNFYAFIAKCAERVLKSPILCRCEARKLTPADI